MSRSVNRVTLMGNLGSDPEVRATSGGGKVATVSLATSRKWTGRDGTAQEKVEWHRVILWDNDKGQKLATLVEDCCGKGDKLYLEGELTYRTWDDKEGVTRYSTEVVASTVVLIGGKSSDERTASAERNNRAVADKVKAAGNRNRRS